MTRIVARAEWGADPRSLPAKKMRLPATHVFVHHSVTTISDNFLADMRVIERVGMSRFKQFSYSYVIHPHDGEILEGCGLRVGAHTTQRNSTAFGVCWAGNYDERQPKVQQIESTRRLIADLKRQGHLTPDAKILGHRDVRSTACPGSKLYALLDALRVPWEEPMPDDPNRPKVNAPIVGGIGAYAENGDVKGYILIGADGGTFHFGEGVPQLGNVEHVLPDGRAWLPKA